MTQWHTRIHKRRETGARPRRWRNKRKYERGRDPVEVKVGPRKLVKIRVRGGNIKLRLYSEEYVNVVDPETNQCRKARILRIVDNPANPHYARRGVITKGAIVETEIGRVRITSRPGQHGVLNGVLIK